jgi:hypothetical protein
MYSKYTVEDIHSSNLGSEEQTSQVLEEMIKAIRPKTNDDVLLLGNIAQRRRNAQCQRDLQKVEHQLGKAGEQLNSPLIVLNCFSYGTPLKRDK